jgi:hypothetical protein
MGETMILMVKKYAGFQMLAVGGSRKSPFGKQAWECSVPERIGAYFNSKMIG